MINLIGNRPPGDEFSWNLFAEFAESEPLSFAIYVWTLTVGLSGTTLTELLAPVLTANPATRVLVCIRDNFSYRGEYDFENQTRTELAMDIQEICARYPDTEFVFFLGLESTHLELDAPNLKVVHMGGCITNQAKEYKTLEPVAKQFTQQTFVSLNRNPRLHRLALVCKLHNQNLHHNAHVSYLHNGVFRKHADIMEAVPWTFKPEHDRFREDLLSGYQAIQALRTETVTQPEYDIYVNGDNNNIKNFNANLRSIYAQSAVEIVTETTFFEPAFLLTEKTLHTFIAQMFPIFVSGRGTVGFLRAQGFDVFDDVVDHSYDFETDPLVRLDQAVELNRRLLTDQKYTTDLWHTHQDRFTENIDFLREGMYNWYIQRAKREFALTK